MRDASRELIESVLLVQDMRIRRWLALSETEPGWIDTGYFYETLLNVTQDELATLNRKIQELLTPYRLGRRKNPPPGARQTSFVARGLPAGRPGAAGSLGRPRFGRSDSVRPLAVARCEAVTSKYVLRISRHGRSDCRGRGGHAPVVRRIHRGTRAGRLRLRGHARRDRTRIDPGGEGRERSRRGRHPARGGGPARGRRTVRRPAGRPGRQPDADRVGRARPGRHLCRARLRDPADPDHRVGRDARDRTCGHRPDDERPHAADGRPPEPRQGGRHLADGGDDRHAGRAGPRRGARRCVRIAGAAADRRRNVPVDPDRRSAHPYPPRWPLPDRAGRDQRRQRGRRRPGDARPTPAGVPHAIRRAALAAHGDDRCGHRRDQRGQRHRRVLHPADAARVGHRLRPGRRGVDRRHGVRRGRSGVASAATTSGRPRRCC